MNADRTSPRFSRQAPPDLPFPTALIDLVGAQRRGSVILDHGFAPGEIKPAWWQAHGIALEFRSQGPQGSRLDRQQLFDMRPTATSSDDALLDFVWHVLAWGSGTSRRNNAARIASCQENVPLLHTAFGHAREGSTSEAYGALIRPGGAAIPHLGPAFFTKLLYFASDPSNPRCLILDARVARSMYALGWRMAPEARNSTFSYNWYTDTYVSYCDLLRTWAERAGGEARADMFERWLFDTGKLPEGGPAAAGIREGDPPGNKSEQAATAVP